MIGITIQRQLAVINNFIEVPDGQLKYRTKLTPSDILSLIAGSELAKLGILQRDQKWVLLPENPSSGPLQDYYQTIRDAAAL